ncbi:MAG: hypothetical protein M1445_00170 [Bacteroidetes bacterium]|nr:hypothetical protein [Bacteroidota bacterium]MCL6102955.1 hypothetical protein [Bacteroidota bacterium]
MISLVMLSWNRVDNVVNFINYYSSYKLIDEIIVFNNNNKFDLRNIQNNKLILIESSKDMGLYTRFAAAGLANNECIMHCDDDLFIPEDTVNRLYEYWSQSPQLCHGTQGRFVINDYNMNEVFGEVQIVLTRCMLVSRANCLSAFKFALNFEDLYSEPKGNGEDIMLSFISISNSGKLNRSYNLPFYDCIDKNNDDGLPIAICRRWKKHIEHRSIVVKRCKSLLGID